jgi:peptidoglycan-associated lipoprotein
MTQRKLCWILLAFTIALFAAGCKKRAPVPPPPPPPPPEQPAPPPPKPSISFSVEPSSIQRGQSATLRWNVQNATEVSIDQGIGTVSASGQRQVFPSANTTYTLTAKGPGGEERATATVTVVEPPPPPPKPEPPKPTRTLVDRLREEVRDVYFDFDKYDIREDARSQLSRNADALKSILAEFPNATITLEGHCDERGSAEYNLGLGDRRATAVQDFLAQLGVDTRRLRTISYGKERPQCTEQTEECWQLNRRVHFSAGQ